MRLSNLALIGAAAIAIGAVSRTGGDLPASLRDVAKAEIAQAKKAARSRNIVVRAYRSAQDHRLFAVAAGVAFYALLAIAPTLAAAVSVFGLFADPAELTKLSASLSNVLPGEAAKLVQAEALRLATQPHHVLSIKLAVALFLSLWTASSAMRALFDALNVIDAQTEQRSIVRVYATSLAATVAGVIVLLLSLAVIGANPSFAPAAPLWRETVWVYSMLRWPLFFGFAVVVIATLYWIGPSRPPASYLRLLPGAGLAALVWALGSSLFSWYVATLANYTATYGSLATVAVVMTWLWLSTCAILLGSQINYELTHR